MTFEEAHPDLAPSKYCGEVKSYQREEIVNDHSIIVEWWERDPVTGKMIDVLERKKLEQQIEQLKKEIESYEH